MSEPSAFHRLREPSTTATTTLVEAAANWRSLSGRIWAAAGRAGTRAVRIAATSATRTASRTRRQGFWTSIITPRSKKTSAPKKCLGQFKYRMELAQKARSWVSEGLGQRRKFGGCITGLPGCNTNLLYGIPGMPVGATKEEIEVSPPGQILPPFSSGVTAIALSGPGFARAHTSPAGGITPLADCIIPLADYITKLAGCVIPLADC